MAMKSTDYCSSARWESESLDKKRENVVLCHGFLRSTPFKHNIGGLSRSEALGKLS